MTDPMHEALRDMQKRIRALEREAVRFRRGQVADVGPLDVTVGGAATPFTAVKAINGPQPLAAGDQIGALTFGGDMLVLGQLADGAGIPIVSALPTTNLRVGQLVICEAVTDTTYWLLMYDGNGPYPWKPLGKPVPLWSEVTTAQTTTSATYAALATAGPSVALPLPGDYDVEIGCRAFATSENRELYMSYDIGGTGAVDADAVILYTGDSYDGLATVAPNTGRPRRKTGLTAVTLTSKYKVSGGTGSFGSRWMKVTPVRVGA